jgi:hypothetical protein
MHPHDASKQPTMKPINIIPDLDLPPSLERNEVLRMFARGSTVWDLRVLANVTKSEAKKIEDRQSSKDRRSVCPLCSWKGSITKNFFAHLKKAHANIPEVVDFCIRVNASERERLQSGSSSPANRSSSTRGTSSSISRFSVASFDSRLDGLCADLIVARGLPLSFFEGEHVLGFVNSVVALAKDCPQCPSDAAKSISGRTTMTKLVDTRCAKVIADHEIEFAHQASQYGATVQMDSFSVAGSSVVHATIVSNGKALVFGTFTTPVKKTSALLVELVKEVLANETYGKFINCVCMDGAANCIAAMKEISQNLHLVTLRCTTHLISLMSKDVFTKSEYALFVFDCMEIVYKFIFQKTTVKDIFLKHILGARRLPRPSPTRFASNTLMLGSMVKMEPQIKTLVGHGLLLAIADKTKESREAFKAFKDVVDNASFWERAKIVLRVTEPMVIALRLIDGANVGSDGTADVMDTLGAKLFQEVNGLKLQDDSEPVEKAAMCRFLGEVMDIYVKRNGESSCPLLDAGYCLNPKHHGALHDEFMRKSPLWVALETSVSGVAEIYANRERKNDTEQLVLFQGLTSAFLRYAALDKIAFVPGCNLIRQSMFWAEHGRDHHKTPSDFAPEFARFAHLVLHMSTSTSIEERVHRIYKLLSTDSRSRLGAHRLSRLARASSILNAPKHMPERNKGIEKFCELEGVSGEAIDGLLVELLLEEDGEDVELSSSTSSHSDQAEKTAAMSMDFLSNDDDEEPEVNTPTNTPNKTGRALLMKEKLGVVERVRTKRVLDDTDNSSSAARSTKKVKN